MSQMQVCWITSKLTQPQATSPYFVLIGTPNWSATPVPLESKANGIFQDYVLGSLNSDYSPQKQVRVNSEDVKDGRASTLLISENIDARYYSAYDDASSAATFSIPILANGTTPLAQSQWQAFLASTAWGDCWERGAGFVWWDTSTTNTNSPPLPPSSAAAPYTVAAINGAKGDYDPVTIGWPTKPSDTTPPVTSPSIPTTNSNYAARPASSHPGGVIMAFAAGNTRFVRDDIDYTIYCLLMTPDGAHATTNSYTIPSGFTNVAFPPAQSWQKFAPVDDSQF